MDILLIFHMLIFSITHVNTIDTGNKSNPDAYDQRFVNSMDKCLFKYNNELLACMRPLLDLVDNNNQCDWRGRQHITYDVMGCWYTRANLIYSKSTYASAKLCTHLKSWSTCFNGANLKQVCNGIQFWSYISKMFTLLNVDCPNTGIYDEYMDCYKQVTHYDRFTSFYSPISTCSFLDSEILSNQITLLHLADIWLFAFPPSMTITKSMRGDLQARIYCKNVEHVSCMERRSHRMVCPTQTYTNMTKVLDELYSISRKQYCTNIPECSEFALQYCKLKPNSFEVDIQNNLEDIFSYYNQSNYKVYASNVFRDPNILVKYSLVAPKCDVRNLILRQISCVWYTFADLNLNEFRRMGYFGKYLQVQLKHFNSCWNIYIEECPVLSENLTYVPLLLSGLTKLLNERYPDHDCPINTILLGNGVFGSAITNINNLLHGAIALTMSVKLYMNFQNSKPSSLTKTYIHEGLNLQGQILKSDLKNLLTIRGSEKALNYIFKRECGLREGDYFKKWVVRIREVIGQFYHTLLDVNNYMENSVLNKLNVY